MQSDNNVLVLMEWSDLCMIRIHTYSADWFKQTCTRTPGDTNVVIVSENIKHWIRVNLHELFSMASHCSDALKQAKQGAPYIDISMEHKLENLFKL